MGVRVVVEALGALAAHGKLAATLDHQQARHLLRPVMELATPTPHSHGHHMTTITIMGTPTITAMTIITTMAALDNNRSSERPVAQWQTPHSAGEQPPARRGRSRQSRGGVHRRFHRRARSVSFLPPPRPHPIRDDRGRRCKAQSAARFEIDALADVGSLTPHLGGGSFRYDPLPAAGFASASSAFCLF